jgi:hypothetical protein
MASRNTDKRDRLSLKKRKPETLRQLLMKPLEKVMKTPPKFKTPPKVKRKESSPVSQRAIIFFTFLL